MFRRNRDLPDPKCDDCGRRTPERVRVVEEYPDDVLYPVSIFMLCQRCAEIDALELA